MCGGEGGAPSVIGSPWKYPVASMDACSAATARLIHAKTVSIPAKPFILTAEFWQAVPANMFRGPCKTHNMFRGHLSFTCNLSATYIPLSE